MKRSILKKVVTGFITTGIIIPSINADYLLKQKVTKSIADSFIKEDNTPQDLTKSQYDYLVSQVNKTKWTKCFDSIEDNRNFSTFHTNCDSAPYTMVIVKDIDSGKTIAGYSGGERWSGGPGYVNVSEARLFNLNEGSFASYAPTRYPQYSVYNNANYGPTFGGHDLYLGSSVSTSNGHCTYQSYPGWDKEFCHNSSGTGYPKQPHWVVYRLED